MIYHITEKENWENAKVKGEYTCGSLNSEGFIHLSKETQVEGVKERYYKGKTGLVLLSVNEEKITSELKLELSPSINEYFPHCYGPLNLDAVEKVVDL